MSTAEEEKAVPDAWPLRAVGTGAPVEDLPELLRLLLVEKAEPSEQRRTLVSLLDLPIATAMPARLRRAVEAFLDA